MKTENEEDFEGKSIMASLASSMAFVPDITELTGAHVEENIRRLGRLETNFAGLLAVTLTVTLGVTPTGGATVTQGGATGTVVSYAAGSLVLTVTAGTFAAGVLDNDAVTSGENVASVSANVTSFLASTLLDPGEGPGAFCDYQLAAAESTKFKAVDEAVQVANEFRGFCFDQFTMVERSMHGKLMAVWESLTKEEQAQLRFHSIMTVNRSTASDEGSHHADSFDGTICCFALMSNKIGTKIYPGAQVTQVTWEEGQNPEPTTPQSQFVEEMKVGCDGPRQRPAALRYNSVGPERGWRDGCCVILAPSVCHKIAEHKATDPSVNDATVGSDGQVLATHTDPRWFCRVTLEIIPAGAAAQKNHGVVNPFGLHSMDPWPSVELRRKVCMLVKDHCWGSLPL